MATVLGANTLASGGYEVDNSVRLDGASSFMTKTMGTPTNTKKYTMSIWFKRSKLDAQQSIFRSTNGNASNDSHFTFNSNNTLRWQEYGGSAQISSLVTNQLFTDISAWSHVVVVYDSAQSTAGNRAKMYLNGTEVTSFGTQTQPSHNADSFFNKDGEVLSLGRSQYDGGVNYYDGYVTEVVMCDGQALAADQFGEFDDSGIWKPIDVSGLTFGTNGFYLDFEASGNLGNDANGGTDFGETNLAAIDQTTDTCTNNFATMNPLDNFFAAATISEGNTKVVTNASAEAMSTSTFALSAGRWYFEVDFVANDGNVSRQCGITPHGSKVMSGISGKAADVTPHAHALNDAGVLQTGNGSGGQTNLGTLTSYTNGDVIGVYMDLEDMKSYFSKNGTLMNSGTGINLSALNANEHDVSGGSGHYMFFVGDNNSAAHTCHANFGNPNTALDNAGVTDDNGFGAFEYSPNITGDSTAKKFYACCTKNLVEFG